MELAAFFGDARVHSRSNSVLELLLAGALSDSVTRTNSGLGSTSSIGLASLVSLLLIDEIHHLGDDRGASLESVVTRMLLTSDELKFASKYRLAKITSNRIEDNCGVCDDSKCHGDRAMDSCQTCTCQSLLRVLSPSPLGAQSAWVSRQQSLDCSADVGWSHACRNPQVQ